MTDHIHGPGCGHRADTLPPTDRPATEPRTCEAPLTDFVIDVGTCKRPAGHRGIHWFNDNAAEAAQGVAPAVAECINCGYPGQAAQGAAPDPVWDDIYGDEGTAQGAAPPDEAYHKGWTAGYYQGQRDARKSEGTAPLPEFHDLLTEKEWREAFGLETAPRAEGLDVLRLTEAMHNLKWCKDGWLHSVIHGDEQEDRDRINDLAAEYARLSRPSDRCPDCQTDDCCPDGCPPTHDR